MNLFRRIQTTLRADAHGVVDALEDDILLLKQHLRDAEAAVEQKRDRLAQLEAERKRLGTEQENAKNILAQAERDADLAVEQNRDDLARYALKQALKLRGAVERLETRLGRSAEEHKALEQTLAQQLPALEELRERVRAFLSDREREPGEIATAPVSDEQVEIELLRRKRATQTTASPEKTAPTRETTHG